MLRKTMLDESVSSSPSSCLRIAIIGAHRNRVAKVLQILLEQEKLLQSKNDDNQCTKEELFLQEKVKQHNIRVEYLPCVAKFGSYQNEDKQIIQYLSSIEHYGTDGNQVRGSSLAPFFDENNNKDGENDNGLCLPGITAVAIGCGIEEQNHIEMIHSFIKNMTQLTSSSDDDNVKNSKGIDFIIESIKPNAEYSSMKEENEAYKNLDAIKKLEANQNHSVGPGKMAMFSVSLVQKTLKTLFPIVTPENNDSENAEGETVPPISTNVTDSNEIDKENEREGKKSLMEACDENKIRFACKICRAVLFGQDHLEDPPHTIGRHQFNHRQKSSSDKSSGGKCASVYLSSEMDWMGDTSSYEGKLACPKCNAKVGLWKWAGTQCSCGTWVTPAIQIVKSKVDMIYPISSNSSSTIYRHSTSATPQSLFSKETTLTPNPTLPENPLAGLYISGKE